MYEVSLEQCNLNGSLGYHLSSMCDYQVLFMLRSCPLRRNLRRQISSRGCRSNLAIFRECWTGYMGVYCPIIQNKRRPPPRRWYHQEDYRNVHKRMDYFRWRNWNDGHVTDSLNIFAKGRSNNVASIFWVPAQRVKVSNWEVKCVF